MTGRHRAPVEPSEHHYARYAVGTSLVVAVSTGPLVAIIPATQPMAQVSVSSTQGVPTRVATSLTPASASIPVSQYRVEPGDTLGDVAPRFGETWQQLYKDNANVIGADPNLIYPNQVLTVASPAVTQPAVAATTSVGRHAVTGQRAVDVARQSLGKPYVWAAAGPGAFDCSGLVQYVYKQLGVDLPHSSSMQSTIGDRVGSLAAAQPGDLLFFFSPVSHVGIYIGNGQMIAAPESGEVVQVQSVWATPTVIRRVL